MSGTFKKSPGRGTKKRQNHKGTFGVGKGTNFISLTPKRKRCTCGNRGYADSRSARQGGNLRPDFRKRNFLEKGEKPADGNKKGVGVPV